MEPAELPELPDVLDPPEPLDAGVGADVGVVGAGVVVGVGVVDVGAGGVGVGVGSVVPEATVSSRRLVDDPLTELDVADVLPVRSGGVGDDMRSHLL